MSNTPGPMRFFVALAVLLAVAVLSPAAEAPPLVRSARSGAWSAADTWEGGKVPAAGARVQIRAGHVVVYDLDSDRAVRSLHVAGTLTFAPDKDTRLDAGLIKIQPGDDVSEEGFDCDAHVPDLAPGTPRPALQVGTPDRPIDAKHTAKIRLVYFEGMDKESCPAIVCCGGHMGFYGAPLSRTWVKLDETAKKGNNAVTLAEAVTGWRPDDRIIITATQLTPDGTRHRPGVPNRAAYTEERTVRTIDGAKIVLDKPLEFEHLGTGEYRAEVANLSRNVVVESADPAGVRGHTMYHRGSAGSISYAEFRHLGKEGVLGRYSLHYHLVGDTMRGSSVIGASIWDSGNRWLTIHGTNYLVVRDCVGYQSVGHGFFLEDGTEVYNVLDRNLAVQAFKGKPLPKQALPFDHNEGAGFWWANSLNTFTRNVSCENDRYGFRFEATQTSALKLTLPVLQPDGSKEKVDIRTLPFVRFEDNESHCEGLYGFNLGEGVSRVGPDTRHPFVVRRTKLWMSHYAFRPQVPSLLVEDMKIYRAEYGVYHPNYDNHVYRGLYIGKTNTEPFNRGHDDDSVQYGLLTVDGLTFEGERSGSFMPLIQISDDNPTGKAVSHFRNVKLIDWTGDKARALVNRGGGPRPVPTTDKGVSIYLHDWFGPGRHAKVASTKARDFGVDGAKYREEPLLTGDESRVAEVRDVEFPKLLDPVDDLPPTTVITHVAAVGGKVTVRGVAADDGAIKKVVVNGREAKASRPNFAEWEIVFEDVPGGPFKVEAWAEDAAGNVEKRPHVFVAAPLRAGEGAGKDDLAPQLRELDARVLPAEGDKAKELARMVSLSAREAIRAANERETKAWREVKTRADWERFRDARIQALRDSLGPFPPIPKDLKVRVVRELEGDGFRIKNLVFESRPGLVVTANLYLPADKPKAAAGILLCHSHHNPKTEGELQDMGMTWARSGSVVLVMDQLGHGERRQHPFVDADSYPHKFRVGRQDYYFRYNVGNQLHLIGESQIGWMVWDLMRGVDLLVAEPGVDKDKIILLGSVAGGGDPTAVTAALDPRISTVVPFNFGGPQPETAYPLAEDAENSFNYAGGGSWESTRNLRLAARDGFQPWVIVGASAPRRLIYAHEFAWDRDRDPVWKRLEKIYDLYEVRDRLAAAPGRGKIGVKGDSTECNNIGPDHRKLMHPLFKRWFDMPAPAEEYRKRLTAKELACLTPEVVAALKPRPVWELAGERADEQIAAARRQLADRTPEERRRWLRKEWTKLLGNVEPAKELKATVLDSGRIGGVTVERVRLEVEPRMVVPLVLLLPARKLDKRLPVVVGIAQGGKKGFLTNRSETLAALLDGGAAVCLPDVRGTGETAPGEARGRIGEATAISETELMLGRTLLGARLRDLRAVLGYLRGRADLDAGRVALWGDSFAPVNAADRDVRVPLDAEDMPDLAEPLGGLLTLFGALFEDDVQAVYARGGLASYRSLLTSPFGYVPHDALVPGAFTAGDLSFVAASLAPRPLRLESLVDGLNRKVSAEALAKVFEPAREAYRSADAPDSLRLGADAAPGGNVAEWLLARVGGK
jgi:dienelactone hydrolase